MRFCVFPTGGAVLKEPRLAQPSFLCTHFPFPAVNKEAEADLQACTSPLNLSSLRLLSPPELSWLVAVIQRYPD